MIPIDLIIALLFPTLFQGASQNLIGTYENGCREKIVLRSDSTFYYSYPVGHGSDWATGTWDIQSKTLVLVAEPILDTVDTTFDLTLEGMDSVYDLDRSKELEEPYTVVSPDTIVNNLDILTADILSAACCGRQLTDFQQNFEIKDNQLIKLVGQDYPNCRKLNKIVSALRAPSTP